MGERAATEIAPWGRHIDEWTVLREQGAQIRMFQVSGLPPELETDETLDIVKNRLNRLHMSVADPRLTFGVHVVKLTGMGVPDAKPMRSTWGKRYDRDFREKVLGADLSRIVVYVSVAYEADAPLGRWVSRKITPKAHRPSPRDRLAMADIAKAVEEGLGPYGPVALGVRYERHGRRSVPFTQVGEAAFAILYGRYERVPITSGALAHALLRDRPHFVRGARSYEVWTPGASEKAKYHGAIWEFSAYPADTWAGTLDCLLDLPCTFVLSTTFGYRTRSQSFADMDLKERQMKRSGDKATGQIAKLGDEQSELWDDQWVRGSHHLSVAVYAPTLDGLDDACAKVRGKMLDTGAVVAQQDWNMDAAWAAQLPGGWHKINRKGRINSKNFAGFASLHNYPAGDAEQRWGAPIWSFRTSGGTLYRHNLHSGDVGSTLVLGMTGKGKSVLLNTFLVGGVERLGARAAFFDKDFGSKPCVLAMGGAYLELGHGRSGLAPLKALSDSEADLLHLERLFTACIHDGAPEGWEMTPDEKEALPRAIAGQMKMPPGMRSWGGVRNVMGWRDRKGAGARLEAWCKGGDKGWVFDNDADDADFSRRCVGFDTTAILKDPTVCGPILSHLAYRVKAMMDGSRFMLIWDEVPAALRVPQFEAMIADELATIRKNEGVVVLASQGPGQLLRSRIADVIREQTPIKMSVENPHAVWEEYEEIGFTRPMFDLVKEGLSVGRKRFVLSRPGANAVLDFDLTAIKEHLWLLSGRRSTCLELDRIRAERGDDPEVWVPVFMERAPLVAAREAAEAPKAEAMERELETA